MNKAQLRKKCTKSYRFVYIQILMYSYIHFKHTTLYTDTLQKYVQKYAYVQVCVCTTIYNMY